MRYVSFLSIPPAVKQRLSSLKFIEGGHSSLSPYHQQQTVLCVCSDRTAQLKEWNHWKGKEKDIVLCVAQANNTPASRSSLSLAWLRNNSVARSRTNPTLTPPAKRENTATTLGPVSDDTPLQQISPAAATDGWMDGWMDGWTDKQIDRPTDRQINNWFLNLTPSQIQI